MAFSRRLGVIWIAAASWLVAVGCDDDGDQISSASAGEGGEAPGGGKPSVAGSKNNGGKAGASAGSAGKGGSTAGGAGAGGDAGNGTTAGSAGQAGSGGAAGGGGEATGGVGGAAGGQGGAGGEGGGAGDGGTIPAIVVPHCTFACTSDEDCLLDGGDDDSEKCNPIRHVCEDPTQACTLDAECLAPLSQWDTPCVNDGECTANTEACVQANGQGYCAARPSAGSPACGVSNVAKILPRFGAAGTVEVCANADPRCFGHRCRPGCGAPNRPCGTGTGDTCNAATGLCECNTGGECSKTGVCGADKHCDTCETTEDCAATITDLACIQGRCGCGDPDECVDFGYANATAQCQLL